LEAIKILLAFSVAKGFKLHQMVVKSAFLNGLLEEEVYVRQPPGFESEKYPHRVYKLRKVLYGLKQAPRAWYGRLMGFLFERGFEMGKVDQTLLSYGPPWAHYLGGYQDRLLGGPLGLPGLRYTAPDGVEHQDYGREVLG
jgi:hypothetical protein